MDEDARVRSEPVCGGHALRVPGAGDAEVAALQLRALCTILTRLPFAPAGPAGAARRHAARGTGARGDGSEVTGARPSSKTTSSRSSTKSVEAHGYE